MDLTEAHQGQIAKFNQFFKGKRERFLGELADIARDVKDQRCNEAVYSQKDVDGIFLPSTSF